MSDLRGFFKSLKYDISEYEAMLPYIDSWIKWYQGYVPKFHLYYIYNGNNKIQRVKKTLNMAKQSCKDYATYLMNEKVQFKFSDERTQEVMQEVLDDTSFYVKVNQYVEKAFAFGTGAIVLGLDDLIVNDNGFYTTLSADKAKLIMSFAQADQIIPLSYTEGEITECAFAVDKTLNGQKVKCISIHKKNEIGNYVIENYLLKVSKAGNLTDITDKLDDTLRVFDTKSDKPWFCIIKPNEVNNIVNNSPFGISVYANAISQMMTCDDVFDSLDNEFVLGKKRIFIKSELMKYDAAGEHQVFDTNDVVFHQLPKGDYMEGDSNPIEESNMALRIADHKEGMQMALNLFSSAVGMGIGVYSFTSQGVKTATEIISEDSDLYKSITRHEVLLEDSLVNILDTMVYICNEFLGLQTKVDDVITIDFDDSIIEDKQATKNSALIEFNAGLIDAVEYFMITRHYTEEQATEFVEKIKSRMPKETEEDFEE